MTAVWSYESDIPKFTEAELYVIAASVLFWKKLNPTHKTVFFCNKHVEEYFQRNNILHIWDEVFLLTEDFLIDKKVFWAATKIIAISKISSPIIHIDLDFFTWENFTKHGLYNSYAAAAFEENTKHYYAPVKSMMQGIKLTNKVKILPIAYNTCVLYIGSDIIKNDFCNVSIEYMQKASLTDTSKIYNVDKSLYMIFAEQQMFASIVAKHKFSVKTIIKEKLIAGKNKYVLGKNNGILSLEQAQEIMVHLGDFKKDLREEHSQQKVIAHIKGLDEIYFENIISKKLDYLK